MRGERVPVLYSSGFAECPSGFGKANQQTSFIKVLRATGRAVLAHVNCKYELDFRPNLWS